MRLKIRYNFWVDFSEIFRFVGLFGFVLVIYFKKFFKFYSLGLMFKLDLVSNFI